MTTALICGSTASMRAMCAWTNSTDEISRAATRRAISDADQWIGLLEGVMRGAGFQPAMGRIIGRQDACPTA
jgi:hypothetical protein